MTDKNLNIEQLENVSGGTLEELNQIMDTLYNKLGVPEAISASGAMHLPPYQAFHNTIVAGKYLKDNGILADINTGLLGTGLLAEPNAYEDRDTGRLLKHQEVMDRLNA